MRDEVLAFKRERILEEARDLIFERGYQGATLDAVAERLNVGKPFIYAHFENKAELLVEICQRGTKYSLAAVDEALRQPGTPTEKLLHMTRNFTRAVYEHRANVAIYFREEKYLPPEAARRIDRWRKEFDDKLSTLLEAGVKAGEFRIRDVRLTTLAIGGMISWMFTWYRPGGRLSNEELVAGMTDLVLKLVGAEGTSDVTAKQQPSPA